MSDVTSIGSSIAGPAVFLKIDERLVDVISSAAILTNAFLNLPRWAVRCRDESLFAIMFESLTMVQ